MSRKLILVLRLATLAALLFLVSCSLPGSTEPSASEVGTEAAPGDGTETAGETLTEAGAEEAPVFNIDPGKIMGWWDGSTFVYVPAGEYQMGDAEATEGDNIPAHTVSLDSFWIHQAEVTNRLYAQCVALGVCQVPDNTGSSVNHYANPDFANHPVVNVDWEDARSYCEWIGGALPSEAQWEWAARGETGTPYYPWGEEEPNCSRLNYAGCITPTFTTPVNDYFLGLSPYFLADTAGNVFEWVNDWYAEGYYSQSPTGNPTGPDTGEERVVRGSSFRSQLEDLPVNRRFSLDPDETNDDLGFRCILSGETLATPTLPACDTLSYVPIPRDPVSPIQPTIFPPALALDVYCNLNPNNGDQYGTALIVFEDGTEVNQVTISSPNGTLICTQDANLPMVFTCVGSALHPGDPVTVSACYPPPPVQPFPDPTCPVYYHLDQTTWVCEYGIPMPVACAAPDVVVPGYGCLPAPVNGDCPVGSYSGTFNNKPVCIPSHGPACQQGQVGTTCPAFCPEGLVLNEGNFCCDYPPDVMPVCPVGYTYNIGVAACLPDQQNQANGCTTITTVVPTCAPPEQIGCWVTTGGLAAAPVTTCVYPCPAPGAGYTIGGSCTP